MLETVGVRGKGCIQRGLTCSALRLCQAVVVSVRSHVTDATETMLVVVLLIRPDEVLSRIANVAVLEVAHHALGVLLQHRHVFVGRLA